MKNFSHSQGVVRVVQLVMIYSVIIFCSSCVNAISDTDSVDELQTSDLTFQVMPYGIVPMTRANQAALQLKTICAVLYKEVSSSNWVKKYETIVAASESGATTISFSSVVHGAYKLVIIGHTGQSSANPSMTDVTAITFPDNKVPEFQYYTNSITVSPTATADSNVTLKLGVAKFQISVTNVSQLNDYTLVADLDGTATAFNALTGLGSAVVQRMSELDLTNRNQLKMTYFLILMNKKEEETNSTINLTLQAKDASANVVSTETFEHVPAEVGYVTIYEGNLFDGPSGNFNVSIQTNYDGEYIGTL